MAERTSAAPRAEAREAPPAASAPDQPTLSEARPARDPSGLAETLAALRATGVAARDPVGWRLAEALARRAGAHAGTARQLIDARLAAVVDRLVSANAPLQAPARDERPHAPDERPHADPDAAASPAAETRPATAPADDASGSAESAEPHEATSLAALLRHAARAKGGVATLLPSPPPGTSASAGATPASAAAEPAPTLQFFKRTWSRLSAEQRLAQSRAALPGNAGPLNSQHLVHRALLLMRELSPEYLERFVGYVDALQWLEQAGETSAPETATAGRPPARRSLPARR